MITPVRYSWELSRAEDQKVIYRMISLQIALWYVRSKTGYNSMSAKEENISLPGVGSSVTFVTWAMYKLLTVQRVETIHQLAEQLRVNYKIESDYLFNDYSFNRLRFRYNHCAWINIEDIFLHVLDLRVWLDFNRLTRNSPVSARILTGIDCMRQ
ncbi:hypothetical protein GCM10027592_36360 [Spirosoma flavus]